MMHFLSLAEFAERVRLSQNTIKSYYRKELLPPPDAILGRSRGWLPETVDAWSSNRRGRGSRSDLAGTRTAVDVEPGRDA